GPRRLGAILHIQRDPLSESSGKWGNDTGHRTPQLTTRCNGSCHWEDTIGSAGFGHGRSSLTRTTWFITGDGHCAWWCLNRAMADSLSLTLTRCGAAEGRRSRSTGKVALVRCTRRLTGVGCFY